MEKYLGLIWFAGYVAAMIAGILTCSVKKKILTAEAIVFVVLSFFSWFAFIVIILLFIGTKLFGAEVDVQLTKEQRLELMKKRYRWRY